MFQVGDLIIYGNEGVCRVESIGAPEMSDLVDMGSDRMYYTLDPLYKQGKVYTPVDTSVFMRHIISKEDAMALIERIPEIDDSIFENRNIRILSELYQDTMKSHECADLVRVVKAVERKREIMIGKGKKLGQVDEKFYKKASDLLHGEFAVVLGIPKEEVGAFIQREVNRLSE
ncbi:MAG: CarD family transcriptional regulator [Firmicutes bacterium]|nr:CarD family transcriptional regulator [Bacillota bacterium]